MSAQSHVRDEPTLASSRIRSAVGVVLRGTQVYTCVVIVIAAMSLSTGCIATQAAIDTTEIDRGPVMYRQELAPSAEHGSDGSLVLTVFYGTGEPQSDPRVPSDRQREAVEVQTLVPTSALMPVHDILPTAIPSYDREMLNTMLNDPRDLFAPRYGNSEIPISSGFPTNGSQFVCPRVECVIYTGRLFIWYVPSPVPGGTARMALIELPEGHRSPRVDYASRAVKILPAMAADVILVPILLGGAAAGADIDL